MTNILTCVYAGGEYLVMYIQFSIIKTNEDGEQISGLPRNKEDYCNNLF